MGGLVLGQSERLNGTHLTKKHYYLINKDAKRLGMEELGFMATNAAVTWSIPNDTFVRSNNLNFKLNFNKLLLVSCINTSSSKQLFNTMKDFSQIFKYF